VPVIWLSAFESRLVIYVLCTRVPVIGNSFSEIRNNIICCGREYSLGTMLPPALLSWGT
jgi:hypothetical protein